MGSTGGAIGNSPGRPLAEAAESIAVVVDDVAGGGVPDVPGVRVRSFGLRAIEAVSLLPLVQRAGDLGQGRRSPDQPKRLC
jgi:hypothetical protein